MGQQIKQRKQHAVLVLLKWLIITPAPACTKWDPAWGNVLNMHIKANEKINLEIQIGHIYMLKTSHLYHFLGSSFVVFSLFLWLGGWGRENLQKRLKPKRICFVVGGLEMNTINILLVKKYRKWWKLTKVFSHLLHKIRVCGQPCHFPHDVLVEQIIAFFQNK